MLTKCCMWREAVTTVSEKGKGQGWGDKSRDLAESASFLSEFLRILSIGFCCHHIR